MNWRGPEGWGGGVGGGGVDEPSEESSSSILRITILGTGNTGWPQPRLPHGS